MSPLDTDASTWAKRRDIPLAILGWIAVIGIFFWLIGHVAHTLVILIIAAFFAYALSPAVNFLDRYIPRFAAILLVYLIVLSGLGFLIYISINTAIIQFSQLAQNLNNLFTSGQFNQSPLVMTIEHLGISPQRISQLSEQLVMQAEQLTASIVPFLGSIFTVVIDILLVAILSIYLLTDGSRFIRKLRNNAPMVHRRRISFFMKTIERIVGGYIRGQTTLAAIIGILIGVGMALFQVPYAVLLGVLSFILEFIPILGTLIAGAICVLLALTKGWLIAILVLGYFIIMHVIEGDILGPRIVGKALGLHPLVSLIALIAGTELFGITGALFASPVAGVVQTILVSLWSDWRDSQN